MSTLALLLSASMLAGSSTLETDLRLPGPGAVSIVETSEGSIPHIEGAYLGTTPGEPSLPLLPVRVELTPGGRATAVRVVEASWTTLASGVYVPPLPEPMPLCLEGPAEALPGPAYESAGWWPERAAALQNAETDAGRPGSAELLVSPFRYSPADGELQVLTSIKVELETVSSASGSSPPPPRDEDARRMLIVTGDGMEAAFEELAERRTAEGIVTEVVGMDEVLASASGRDDAEALRNYVIDYRDREGLDFLLLGGDTGVVPVRYAYAMTCEAGLHPREDSLPCDLYFSDLDGNWDGNGNGLFGELADGVDLYADVYVGRAPVRDSTEASVFISKMRAYEDGLETDHYRSALFLAEILWWDPYTNSAESKDHIDEEYVPGYMDITKLYQSEGNENLATVMMALNEGTNMVNHDGHAWYNSLGIGDGYMGPEHLDAIDSDGRFASVMYSIGCWSAAYDFDAVAEHFVNNPEGCGVSYIGNSSYGWGSPGNPCYGYSDALDHVYFQLMFGERSLTNGELMALVKEYFIPFSRWENVYRWHQYEVNLLGDPAFRPYRDDPAVPTLSVPELVGPGTSVVPVVVSGAEVEGLTVCVMDDGGNHQVAELDASGSHTFVLEGQAQGDLTVTVTGAGVRRTSVTVAEAQGPSPTVTGLEVDDVPGLGHLSPGAAADLLVTVTNQGTQGLSGLSLTVDSVSGPATLTQASGSFGDLDPGGSAVCSPPLSLAVDGAARTGQVVTLSGTLSSVEGEWDLLLPMLVHAPGIYFSSYDIDDTAGGDGDGVAEAGESFVLEVGVANLGLLAALDLEAAMESTETWLEVTQGSAAADSVPAGGTVTLLFAASLDAAAPEPSFPWMGLSFEAGPTGYTGEDSLMLTVGETGISNDVEGGEAGWIHSGTLDLWEITEDESHSGSHSWRCADADGYVPGMDCSLLSPELVLSPCAGMTFWSMFDVALYGSDGLYVILNDLDAAASDTLDFVGSGGALGGGARGTGTGWVPREYDLSGYPAGTRATVELRFVSDLDGEVGGGFCIDDITVEGAYARETGVVGTAPAPPPVMGAPRPNPASGSVSVPVSIDGPGQWELLLFDLSGRMVGSRPGEGPFLGSLEMAVGGLPGGVYVLMLDCPEGSRAAPVVLLGR